MNTEISGAHIYNRNVIASPEIHQRGNKRIISSGQYLEKIFFKYEEYSTQSNTRPFEYFYRIRGGFTYHRLQTGLTRD